MNGGTDLSGRVSFRCFTRGVVGASFVTVKQRIKASVYGLLEGDGNGDSSTHPESRLHLGLEDVTFQVVGEHGRRRWRVQGLLRQVLLFPLRGAAGGGRRCHDN